MMRIAFDRLRLKQDIDRAELLRWGHFSLVVLGLIIELFSGFLGWWALIIIPIVLGVYKLFFRTARELYYTFWTFSAIAILYFIIGMIKSLTIYDSTGLFYVYFLALILMSVEMYILSSPIYYPQVTWWEYDFRYRHELKIKAKQIENEDKVDGRLTDLRREAGCVSFFEDFKIGDTLCLESSGDGKQIELKVEIVSKRQYSLGRPITYGVRFLLTSSDDRKEYETISRLWQSERKIRLAKKFETLKES